MSPTRVTEGTVISPILPPSSGGGRARSGGRGCAPRTEESGRADGEPVVMTTAIRWHRPLVYFAGAMAVLTVIAIGGLIVDDRVLVGAPIWLKPFKFAVSFTVYALTLAWLLTLLRRGRRGGWWAGTVIAVAGMIEMAVIVGQVVRGRRSHFNMATPLDGALWSVMGATIVFPWLPPRVSALRLWG